MYLDIRIPLPAYGRLTRQRIRGVTYINYEYDRVYDKERRFNIPRRATIGKLDSNGMLIPNENYRKYFPGENLPGEKPRSFRSSCLRIGSFLLIRKLSEDYGLPRILGDFFSPRDLGLFLDLAAYSLVCEDNAAQYYPDYAYNHPLFTDGMRMYSDSKVSEFLGSVTDDQSAGFLNRWNQGRDCKDRIYISYDATNKNSQAGELSMVEFGKAKDDSRLPVFSHSIAHDVGNRIPLFYEEYPGSVVDVSQLQFMLGKAKGYGYRNVGFILDRGYFCKDNIRFLDENGYGFILMVKGLGKLVSELVLSRRGTFECSRSCDIREYKAYGITVKAKLYAEDTRERYFHIYHGTGREHAEREQIEIRMEKMAKLLRQHEGEEYDVCDCWKRYYDLHYDGKKFLFAREKSEVVERELELCGYFCIVTSEEMTAREALTLYKSRDDSEKLFRGDKSYLGDRTMRVHTDESTSAKLFIEFVALIIRNKIYTSLKSAVLKNERKANYMTVPAALRELEKIEMIRGGDGIYRLGHAVTATQKEILRAFGLNEEFVKIQANELSETLRKL
jgi:hypothetical protein